MSSSLSDYLFGVAYNGLKRAHEVIHGAAGLPTRGEDLLNSAREPLLAHQQEGAATLLGRYRAERTPEERAAARAKVEELLKDKPMRVRPLPAVPAAPPDVPPVPDARANTLDVPDPPVLQGRSSGTGARLRVDMADTNSAGAGRYVGTGAGPSGEGAAAASNDVELTSVAKKPRTAAVEPPAAPSQGIRLRPSRAPVLSAADMNAREEAAFQSVGSRMRRALGFRTTLPGRNIELTAPLMPNQAPSAANVGVREGVSAQGGSGSGVSAEDVMAQNARRNLAQAAESGESLSATAANAVARGAESKAVAAVEGVMESNLERSGARAAARGAVRGTAAAAAEDAAGDALGGVGFGEALLGAGVAYSFGRALGMGNLLGSGDGLLNPLGFGDNQTSAPTAPISVDTSHATPYWV